MASGKYILEPPDVNVSDGVKAIEVTGGTTINENSKHFRPLQISSAPDSGIMTLEQKPCVLLITVNMYVTLLNRQNRVCDTDDPKKETF